MFFAELGSLVTGLIRELNSDVKSGVAMKSDTIQVTEELNRYIRSVSVRMSETQRQLQSETAKMPEARMQISPEQGQFMGLLVRLLEAERTLDIGVFTGYSALSVARKLPEDGLVIACDISEEWTDIAQEYWRAAGIENKIDLRLAPAADTLQSLIDEGQSGTFDFAFIDADKISYDTYYEQCLQLLRPGGLIMLDNVLRGGRVLDRENPSPSTRAIQELNRKIHKDSRVDISMIPMRDGITLVRKRGDY